MKTIRTLLSLAAGFAMMMATAIPLDAKVTAADITGSAKASHVNIAIFHKLHGHEGFAYPRSIAAADILSAMAGKAQFVALSHTAGLQDGDVITMANDVLREGAEDFEDFGVDCQMTVHVQGKVVTLSGMCEMLMLDQDHRQIEHKGLIKPVAMKPGSDWQLVYEDAEDGIAVYAAAEFGGE